MQGLLLRGEAQNAKKRDVSIYEDEEHSKCSHNRSNEIKMTYIAYIILQQTATMISNTAMSQKGIRYLEEEGDM